MGARSIWIDVFHICKIVKNVSTEKVIDVLYMREFWTKEFNATLTGRYLGIRTSFKTTKIMKRLYLQIN